MHYSDAVIVFLLQIERAPQHVPGWKRLEANFFLPPKKASGFQGRKRWTPKLSGWRGGRHPSELDSTSPVRAAQARSPFTGTGNFRQKHNWMKKKRLTRSERRRNPSTCRAQSLACFAEFHAPSALRHLFQSRRELVHWQSEILHRLLNSSPSNLLRCENCYFPEHLLVRNAE